MLPEMATIVETMILLQSCSPEMFSARQCYINTKVFAAMDYEDK
jgi:hypothetical protein